MKKLKRNQLLGVIIILVGVAILGRGLDFWSFDILFDGWWTLFIIVPAIVDIFNGQNVISALLVFLVGMLLFFICQGMIAWGSFGRYILPVALIIIGLSLIFRYKDSDLNQFRPKQSKATSDNPNFVGIGCGNDVKPNFEIDRGSIVSIFGSVDLDLSKAIIKKDIIIECVSIFGSIDIIVPDGYDVKASGNAIFGSTRDMVCHELKKDSHTIYLNYTCIFGKINIK